MKLVEGTADIENVDGFIEQLNDIGKAYDTAIQAFDARYVAGKEHLSVAVHSANRAFAGDDAIADERGIEILLYAAGRRQIDQALEMGVSDGETPVVIVIDGGDEPSAVDEVSDLIIPASVLGESRDEKRIQGYFGITDEERAATDADFESLVIERVALLTVEK